MMLINMFSFFSYFLHPLSTHPIYSRMREVKHMKRKSYAAVLSLLVSTSILSTNALTIFAEGENQPPQSNNGGTPPEKPDGDTNGTGTPPDKPEGGGMGGADTQSFDYSGSYSGVKSATGSEESSSDETISTTEVDQNALLAQDGGTLTVENGTIEKSGDDTNGDNCNFYGLNSIALSVGSNSLLKIANSKLSAESQGSNAIFSTDNATAYSYKNTISTTADNSRGLDATYGGTILGDSTDISTQGDHSASVATDRGGGNVSLTNSTLATSGSGSPLLYSTGDIEVDNVTGTATGSQIAGMEGLNKLLVYNSQLSSTNNAISGSDPIKNGVIIYQSTSGDADTSSSEKARFEASQSVLSTTIDSGSMFYLTNTNADIVLSSSILSFDSENVNLLQVEGNDANNWGTAGKNGANVTFTGLSETLEGNIVVDTISSADVYLLNGTSYTGATSITQNAVNTAPTDTPLSMNVSSDSTWIVTNDSTVTNLNVEDGGKIVDADGKTVSIVANGKTVVDGDSSYTVTVTGNYGTSFETSEENQLSTDYIDRSNFDSTYNVSTTFATNAQQSNTTTANETSVDTKQDAKNNVVYAFAGIASIVIVGGVIYFVKKKNKN